MPAGRRRGRSMVRVRARGQVGACEKMLRPVGRLQVSANRGGDCQFLLFVRTAVTGTARFHPTRRLRTANLP